MKDVLDLAQTIAIVVNGAALIFLITLIRKALVYFNEAARTDRDSPR